MDRWFTRIFAFLGSWGGRTVRTNVRTANSKSAVQSPQPTQIGDLPLEILLHIFTLLDAQGLIHATETCKHWNDIIGQEKKLMERITFKIPSNWMSYAKYITNPSKVFRKVQLSSSRYIGRKEHLFTIHNVLINVTILDLQEIILGRMDWITLFSLPALDVLHITAGAIIDWHEPTDRKSLANWKQRVKPLTDFTVSRPNISILTLALQMKLQFKTLTIRAEKRWRRGWSWEIDRDIERLINIQKGLDTITIQVDSTTVTPVADQIKSAEIRQLNIEITGWGSEDNDLREVITPHLGRLKNLKISTANFLPGSIINTIYELCDHRHNVTIEALEIEHECAYVPVNHQNRSLRTLRLLRTTDGMLEVDALLRMFPFIHDLQIYYGNSRRILVKAFLYQRELRCLSLPRIDVTTPPLQFRQLEHLHVREISQIYYLSRFLSRNPTVTKLTVDLYTELNF